MSELGVILPAVLLLYSALLPSEVRLELAGQNIYATRIVGFLILPTMISRLAGNVVRLIVWDYIFLFTATWMVIAFIVYYGPGTGILRGGALAFDVAIPYLAGRTCIRNTNDFRRFLIYAAPGLGVAALSMLVEVLAARPLVRPAAAQIFGNLQAYEGGIAIGRAESFIDRRLGILRASGD